MSLLGGRMPFNIVKVEVIMKRLRMEISDNEGLKDKIRKNGWMLVIYAVALFLAIIVGFQKINFHVDEVFSYGLANSVDGITINPQPLEKIENADAIFMDYMTVRSGSNYSYVWENQAEDVHPPFYYALLHTICSFFPGMFSMWFAYALNLFFFLLTIFIAFKLTVLLSDNRTCAIATSAFLAISPAMLEANTFLRMYIMAMFLASLFTYLLLSGYDKENGWRFYLSLGITAVCGAMTHYYILIYIFFLSIYYVALMICRKQIRNMILFIGSMAVSGFLSYIIFPEILKHIFMGQRGQQSFDNLMIKGNYGERLKTIWDILASRIFGGYIVIIIVLVLGIAVYITNKKISLSQRGIKENGKLKKDKFIPKIGISASKFLKTRSSMVLFAVIAYLLLVSKIAPYLVPRYIYVIYPIILILLVNIIYYTSKKFFVPQYKFFPFFACLLLLLLGEYIHCPWEYFYKESEEALRVSGEYKEKECIYIYETGGIWKAQSSFYELKDYSSLIFVPIDRLEELENVAPVAGAQAVVYIQDSLDQEATLQKLKEVIADMNGWKDLYQYSYHSIYLLE